MKREGVVLSIVTAAQSLWELGADRKRLIMPFDSRLNTYELTSRQKKTINLVNYWYCQVSYAMRRFQGWMRSLLTPDDTNDIRHGFWKQTDTNPRVHKQSLFQAFFLCLTQTNTHSHTPTGVPSIFLRAVWQASWLGNSKGLLQVRMLSHSHLPSMRLQPVIRFSLQGSNPSSWSSSQFSSGEEGGRGYDITDVTSSKSTSDLSNSVQKPGDTITDRNGWRSHWGVYDYCVRHYCGF